MTTENQAFSTWVEGYPIEERPKSIAISDAFSAGYEAGIKSTLPPEETIPYKEVIKMLNEIAGRSFKVTPAHTKHIHARWAEGMRPAHFERVIRTKTAQWNNDPKMALFLRPETLFGTRMDSYLNEPEPTRKKTIRNHLGIEVEVDDN
jgi:uncharacterized phage protein (TIGR02220 family)